MLTGLFQWAKSLPFSDCRQQIGANLAYRPDNHYSQDKWPVNVPLAGLLWLQYYLFSFLGKAN
jgi:hypothetical protein